MESIQGGSSSASDARAASVGLDVLFSRGHGCRPWRVFPREQDALAPVPRTTYFRNGPNSMCRTMRWTVYSLLSVDGLFKKLRLLDRNIATSEAEFTCHRMRVWRGCDKGVDVSIVGAWDTRTMDTVLRIPSSSVVSVCS